MPLEKSGDRLAGVRQQIDGADERRQPRLARRRRAGRTAGRCSRGSVIGVMPLRELRVGGDVADAAAQVGGVGRHDLAEHLDPAGGRAVQAEDEAQEGGLAGAVGPEQAEDAARLDRQGDVVEGDLAVLVDLGEAGRLDHQPGVPVGHGGPSPCGPVPPMGAAGE